MEERLYAYKIMYTGEDYGRMAVNVPSFYMRSITLTAIFYTLSIYLIVSLATQEAISSFVFSIICGALAWGIVYLDRRSCARRTFEKRSRNAEKKGFYFVIDVNYDFYSDHLMFVSDRRTIQVMYNEIVRVYTDDNVIYLYTKKFNLVGIIKKSEAPAGLIEFIETNIPEGDAKGRVKK